MSPGGHCVTNKFTDVKGEHYLTPSCWTVVKKNKNIKPGVEQRRHLLVKKKITKKTQPPILSMICSITVLK